MEFVGKIGSRLFRSVSMGSRGIGATKRGYCVRPVGVVDDKVPAGSVEPVVSVAKADDYEDEDDTNYAEQIRILDERLEKLRKFKAELGTYKPVPPEEWIRAGLPVMSDEELARWNEELWEKVDILLTEEKDLPDLRDDPAYRK